ncbi:guanitoxin biosynthesis L-enduracididine beta-hydroxylase GntD [Streptomyces sp. NBC_01217]|uniref:guanitoxin biosynthesis L-enduracididine beta-hydroxylase GntD n=1 Tax=Streptomyces sp. NBC_01217 TaxID=2903779 RepID=UPI002E10A448|nr:TauD/TfdA family dioxygenase [Streptomyces sp. NBC_01217]
MHPDIARALAVWEEEPLDRRLVAYVVPAGPGQSIDEAELGKHLAGTPHSPDAFVELAELPQDEHGGVDSAALPAYVVATDLLALWGREFTDAHVTLHDEFFELGGYSLLAVRLTVLIRERYGIDLPLADFFDLPTVLDVAEHLVARGASAAASPPLDAAPPSMDELLDEIGQLSEEDVLALLGPDSGMEAADPATGPSHPSSATVVHHASVHRESGPDRATAETRTRGGIWTIELTGDEIGQVETLIRQLLTAHPTIKSDGFLEDVVLCAQEMPRTIRRQANEFRLHEPAGGCLFTGLPVNDQQIGDTPAQWGGQAEGQGATRREDAFLLMCASLLGDPISWATQQHGRLIHDVIPIAGHELEQINSSTSAPLWWHTEDAFHPFRAEYVGLMCLRNPDAVETTYAVFDDLNLPSEIRATLFEPRYVIRPDESHLPKNRDTNSRLDAPAELLQRSFAWVERMATAPEKVPVLFGDPNQPYGRLDPYFMDRVDGDPAAVAAFDALTAEIDDKLSEIVLSPGDVLFIDNYKAVHGRKPFTARFDGRDRWLRRTNVSRDLRKSRGARTASGSRVIF